MGRLAWQSTDGSADPPVGFVLQDGAIYLRMSARSTIAELAHPTEVALEVDDLDLEQRAGWSVVLHGRSQAADEPAGLRPLGELDSLAPWAARPADAGSQGDPARYLQRAR